MYELALAAVSASLPKTKYSRIGCLCHGLHLSESEYIGLQYRRRPETCGKYGVTFAV